MTAEERRVIEALQAHTGGLTVTEQDIHHAQRQLQETLEITSKRPPRGPFLLAAAAVIVLIAGVVGFMNMAGDDKSSTGPAQQGEDPDADFIVGTLPTASLLQGVWYGSDGLLVRFTPPDRVSFNAEGLIFHAPHTEGSYDIAGETITVTIDGGTQAGECLGTQFSWRLRLPEANVAHLVSGESAGQPGDCASAKGERSVLRQVLPTHSNDAGWGPPAKGDVDWPAAGWQTPRLPRALQGDWLAHGGGYLLEVAPDGTYYVADDSGASIDSGAWTFRGDSLTLTSQGGSAGCSVGDRVVLGAVELLTVTYEPLAGSTFMRAAPEQEGCGRAWAAAAGWMRYSPEG